MAIQAENFGKLSHRRLCGKMELEDMKFSSRAAFNWAIALGIKKYKRYIRPKLMPHHYISRLEWVLDDPVKDESGAPKLPPCDELLGEEVYKYVDPIDRVHIDEK